MKKIWFSMCMCVVIFLSACAPSASPSGTAAVSESLTSSGQPLAENGLSFPKVEVPPTANLGFDPQDRIYTVLELNYNFEIPNKGFIQSLSDLDGDSFNDILEQDNYFEIDEHVLFYYNLSIVGPSKLCLGYPDGQVQEIFTCSQPIYQVTFLPEKRDIIIGLAYSVYFDGAAGIYYELDLLEGKLIPTDFDELYFGDTGQKMLYQGMLYYQLYDISTGIGALYKGIKNDQYIEIVDNVQGSVYFSNNKVYYRKPNEDSIYYCNLKEESHTQEMMLEGIKGSQIYIYREIIIYNESSDFLTPKIVMANIITSEIIAELPISWFDEIANCTNKGLYFHNVNDELVFCDFKGDMTTLFIDVAEVFVEAVLDEWVYFSIRQLDSNGATPYGRVRLDGTDLVYFS